MKWILIIYYGVYILPFFLSSSSLLSSVLRSPFSVFLRYTLTNYTGVALVVEFPEATEQRRKEAMEREEREEREEKGDQGEGGGETKQQGSDTTNIDLGRIKVAVGATVGFRLPACCPY